MTINCRTCGTAVEVPVTEEQIRNWQGGMLIQRAMPNLSPSQREMLLTAICGECWDRMFKNEEEY